MVSHHGARYLLIVWMEVKLRSRVQLRPATSVKEQRGPSPERGWSSCTRRGETGKPVGAREGAPGRNACLRRRRPASWFLKVSCFGYFQFVRTQYSYHFPKHGCLWDFCWKNPKEHRLMIMGTPGNMGTSLGKQLTGPVSFGRTFSVSLSWFLQRKFFTQKMEGHGQWLPGGLFKVGKQETLPAASIENLRSSDPSNFTITWNYQ